MWGHRRWFTREHGCALSLAIGTLTACGAHKAKSAPTAAPSAAHATAAPDAALAPAPAPPECQSILEQLEGLAKVARDDLPPPVDQMIAFSVALRLLSTELDKTRIATASLQAPVEALRLEAETFSEICRAAAVALGELDAEKARIPAWKKSLVAAVDRLEVVCQKATRQAVCEHVLTELKELGTASERPPADVVKTIDRLAGNLEATKPKDPRLRGAITGVVKELKKVVVTMRRVQQLVEDAAKVAPATAEFSKKKRAVGKACNWPQA